VLPGTTVTGSRIRYNLVTFKDGKTQTFPSGIAGSPLDWDFMETACWESEVVDPESPVRLVTVTDENSDLDAYTLSGYIPVRRRLVNPSPEQRDRLRFTFESDLAKPVFFVRKYIRDEVHCRKERLTTCTQLCLQLKEVPAGLSAGFITTDGFTYEAVCPQPQNGIVRIPLSELKQVSTALIPLEFPVFLDNYFQPAISIPFRTEKIETLELRLEKNTAGKQEIEVGSFWLE
ncbi:MAG: hypothetical protein Q8914_10765, partial [Bacteroidota bacterium]|nr:hypothetical protein [Bacteroidota bacterium]